MMLPSPSMVVAMTALIISISGAAVAANGGSFTLGRKNVATGTTILNGRVNGPSLTVRNQFASPGSSGLRVAVPKGSAPLVVNSRTKVKNLNADLLDGLDSRAFRRPVAASPAVHSRSNIAAPATFVMGPTYTAAIDSICDVELVGQLAASQTSGLGPYFRAAIKRGPQVSVTDNDWGFYFSMNSAGVTPPQNRLSTFLVPAKQTVQFGAYYGEVNQHWNGAQSDVSIRYTCYVKDNVTPVSVSTVATTKQSSPLTQ
jgi:hypothetical protein